MANFPPANYISNAGRTEGEGKAAWEDWLAATKQLPGGAGESTLTIASGTITPTGAIHSVDTEAAAGADDLTHAAVTNMPDGSALLLRAASASRIVTVKYAAGGTGQFDLVGQRDVVLASPYSWLLLKQSAGTLWTEVARFNSDVASVAEYARLEYTNATTLTLRAGVVPIWITGHSIWQLRLVPDAGISLGNGGLSVSSKYFVYATASGSSLALEASLTGRAINGGVQCKQADRSRTLVGMIHTNESGQFVDSHERRQVVSWYGRRPRTAQRSTAGPVPLSLTSPTALASGILFLQWGDQADAMVGLIATVSNNTATKYTVSILYIDGVATASTLAHATMANDTGNIALTRAVAAGTDVLRTVQLFGQVDAGIGSWTGIEEWAQFWG